MTSDDKQTIPRSARLPSTTPDGTRHVVSALADIAGAVSRERLASHMGLQLTGALARAIGSAILYGFIATDMDKKLVITERGATFVGDDEAQAKRAEREALVSTGFGVVIKKLSTRTASAGVIALRLQEDLRVPDNAARDRATLLVKAAADAALVVKGKFDGGAIEDAIDVVGQPEVPQPARKKARAPKPPPTSVASAERLAATTTASPTPPPPPVSAAGDRSESKATTGEDVPPSVPKAAEKAPERHVELPSATPKSALRVVTTLAALGGPATRERIAGRLNVKLAGRLVSAIVAAILYGFIEENEDGKLVMTERGHALIGDDEDVARQALQHGIMSTGFGATIRQLSTHTVDVEVVAVRLADDQGLSDTSAAERAKVLVTAATDAGLIVNGRFEAESIEDAVGAVGTPSTPSVSLKAKTEATPQTTPAVERPPARTGAANGAGASEKEGGSRPAPAGPFAQAAPAAPVQIVLQIDASNLDAKEIGQIVRELRATAVVSTAGS